MKNLFLASTIIARRPVAFNNVMAPMPYGSTYNYQLVQQLIGAAEFAANQTPIDIDPNEPDLGERSAESQAMLPYWDLTDDIIEGYDAIKAQGNKYLPKFHDESQDEFNDRLELTEFTNVFRDICETLAGKPFEEETTLITKQTDVQGKEIDIAIPDQIAKFCENVDGSGNNLTSFAGATFFNSIVSAIDWIYVDYPKVDKTQVRTMADYQRLGIRPFWSHVLGRNILEVKSAVVLGAEVLTYMRILEPGTPNHIRIFERTPVGVVVWGLFEELKERDGTKKKYRLVDGGNISIGVIPLVPFATGRRNGRTWKFRPALRDAADLQIKLYQQESGLNFAKTMTAYPMLAANGIKAPKERDGKTPKKLRVGPSRVLYSEPDGAGNVGSWGYVSPDAACLTFLKDDIKETMDQLRELGKQPLTAQSGNLTVITTAVAASKSQTSVGAWALGLKDALENAMLMTCQWFEIKDYEPEVNVYDDFDDYASDPAAAIGAIQAMRTARDLSYGNYIREMKRRGVLRADLNEQSNLEELLEEVPTTDETAADDGTGGNSNSNA